MINLDDGLILIGPGSEWFWTAFQGVVVAASLWALFRQLRMQTAQKMRDDVASLQAEYYSERMLRYRLVVSTAFRDGTAPNELPQGAAFALEHFWEEVAGFTKAKHLDKRVMADYLGTHACVAWTALEPFIQYIRQELQDDLFAEGFERFVKEIVRIDPTLATELNLPRSRYAQGVARLEELIAVETALRH
jgi:hypothetical protein